MEIIVVVNQVLGIDRYTARSIAACAHVNYSRIFTHSRFDRE